MSDASLRWIAIPTLAASWAALAALAPACGSAPERGETEASEVTARALCGGYNCHYEESTGCDCYDDPLPSGPSGGGPGPGPSATSGGDDAVGVGVGGGGPPAGDWTYWC